MNDRRTRIVEVLRAIIHEIRMEKLPFMAGSIAYHAFVSLLPLLVLLLIASSLIGGNTLKQSLLSLTQSILTPGANDILIEEIRHIRRSVGLSLLGIVVLLWGSLRIFRGLDTAFSDVYETERENTIADQFSDALVVLVTVGVAIVVAAVIDSVIPTTDSSATWWLVHQLVLVVVLAFALFPIYYVFPDADVSAVEVVPGVLVTAIGLTVLSSVFRVYVRFSSQSGDVNLLANVVLLLTWLYFIGFVFLLGIVVNAVLSNRSSDVDIEPVIGGDTRDTDCTDLTTGIDNLERLLADAEAVVVTVGDEQVTLTPPTRVRTDRVGGSESGSNNERVGIELEWQRTKE